MEKLNNKIKKIKESQSKIKQEVKKHTITYILAALGFVVGLAWNDAIKALIDFLYPIDKNSLFAKFIYAFIITATLVIVTIFFVKMDVKKEEGEKIK